MPLLLNVYLPIAFFTETLKLLLFVFVVGAEYFIVRAAVCEHSSNARTFGLVLLANSATAALGIILFIPSVVFETALLWVAKRMPFVRPMGMSMETILTVWLLQFFFLFVCYILSWRIEYRIIRGLMKLDDGANAKLRRAVLLANRLTYVGMAIVLILYFASTT